MDTPAQYLCLVLSIVVGIIVVVVVQWVVNVPRAKL